MRNHNHSFIRFIADIILVVVLLLILLSPVYFILSLKISDFKFQAFTVESVAGAKSQK